jgi:hypothetical protein
LTHFLSGLHHGLDEIEAPAGRPRRLSPEELATLERSVARIQQLLHEGRNGDGHGNGHVNGEAGRVNSPPAS